ncbi:MAG: hypothetical protein AB1756_08110 [Acidobacteriota bacterium]
MRRINLPVLFLLILGTMFYALADQMKLSCDGTLHKIEIVYLEGSTDDVPRTSLCHTMQKPDGSIERFTIPTTGDLLADLDPQLDLNPSSQLPSIAWSRFDGLDYEIAFSTFDGSRWSTPKLLTSNCNNDREPKIIIGNSNLIHLMWKEETPGVSTYYHVDLTNSGSLSSTPDVHFPPEENLVLPDGTTPPTSTYPNDSSIFYAFQIPTPGLRRVVIWGGRDDPSPINFQEGFRLNDSTTNVTSCKAEKVNARLVLIFRSGDKLYYTYRTQTSWTDYRMIKLDGNISEGRAELLVKEMLGRLP